MSYPWPLDKLGVINRALAMTGDNLVQAVDDGSDEWNVASPAYDAAIGYISESHSWGFAELFTTLAPSLTAPSDPSWDTAYPVPPDCVHILWVKLNQGPSTPGSYNAPVLYDIMGSNTGPIIVTNSGGLTSGAAVSLRYISNAGALTNSQSGTPTLVLALQQFVMAGVYRGLHEDPAESDKVYMAAERMLQLARSRYDMQKPKRQFFRSRIQAARRFRVPFESLGLGIDGVTASWGGFGGEAGGGGGTGAQTVVAIPTQTPSYVNVIDYGVYPNNNDCYLNLKAALTAIAGTGQGLYFPSALPGSGNYYFIDSVANGNVPLQIPTQTVIKGDGWGGSPFQYTGDACFDITGGRVQISCLLIDGQRSTSATKTAIRLRTDLAANGTMQYIHIFDMFTNQNGSALSDQVPGITTTHQANTMVFRNWQDKCTVGLPINSIDLRYIAGAIEFVDCHMNTPAGSAETSTRWHWYFSSAGGLFLTNCSAKGTFDGVNNQSGQHGMHLDTSLAVWLTNCNVENMGGQGVEFDNVNFLRSFGLHVGACDLTAMTLNKVENHKYFDTDIVGNALSAGFSPTANGIVGTASSGSAWFVSFHGLYMYQIAQDAINLDVNCDSWRFYDLDIRQRGSSGGGAGRDGIRSVSASNVLVASGYLNNCAGYNLNASGGSGIWRKEAFASGSGLGYMPATALAAGWVVNIGLRTTINVAGSLGLNLGTISADFTLAVTAAEQQYYTNNGAHVLHIDTNCPGNCILDITNGASAGAIGLGAFIAHTGSFDTTAGHTFRCLVSQGNAGAFLAIQRMT